MATLNICIDDDLKARSGAPLTGAGHTVRERMLPTDKQPAFAGFFIGACNKELQSMSGVQEP